MRENIKKTAICKSNILSPNFKKGKLYYYEFNNNEYIISDDFNITFKFDKKHQNKLIYLFIYRNRNILFDDIFYQLHENRKLKLKALQIINQF